MKNNAFYIFVIFILFGCTTIVNKEGNIEKININLSEIKPQYFDSLFSNLKSISFDKNKGLLIGEINNVIITDSLVIINDGRIKIFNSIGLLKKEIDKKGEGPNEYLTISAINFFKNNLLLLDRRGRKILKMNCNGEVENSYSLGAVVQDFSVINDTVFFLYNGYNPFKNGFYKVSKYNTNERRIVNTYLSYYEKQAEYINFMDVNNFFNLKKDVSLVFSCSNIIYSVSEKGEFSERLTFDFGKNNLNKEIIDREYSDVMSFEKELKKKNVIYRFMGMWETTKHLVFGFKFKENYYLAVHNKKDNKTTIIDKLLFQISGKTIPIDISFEFLPKSVFDDQLIFVIDPAWVLDVKDKLIKSNLITEEEMGKSNHVILSKKYNPINNPFLLKVKLK